MAKLIKLTDDVIEQIKLEFDSYIRDKIADGRISFQKNVGTVQRKAAVYFTRRLLLFLLIRQFHPACCYAKKREPDEPD